MYRELLQPLAIERIINLNKLSTSQWGSQIDFNTGQSIDLSAYHIALIGVEEDRENLVERNCAAAPDTIRRELYKLYNWEKAFKIIDLGNIKNGATVYATAEYLASVLRLLLRAKVIPIVLGGTHDLSYGQFMAYEAFNQSVNMSIVDEKIDMLIRENEINSQSFIYNILSHQPYLIDNLLQIGYQHYHTDPLLIRTFEKLQHQCYRLAYFREDFRRFEPLMRQSDLLAFDFSALKAADAPGQKNTSPNGLTAEEACRLMRYAGISDRLSSLGLYEYFPRHDNRYQTAQLAAQMIWHFVEGYYNRLYEYPEIYEGEFLQYTIPDKINKQALVFYKSKISGRWWLKISLGKDAQKYSKIIPCLEEDFKMAQKGNIPETWISNYIKYSASKPPIKEID
ncbi:MAG: formimidoylglutamase [Chitinophagales bacterium]|nr:formimidoylglutamase [Bacteroidota bacterium]MCB9043068.1 formimidoylglutamase [Chitinophagales bacterium]